MVRNGPLQENAMTHEEFMQQLDALSNHTMDTPYLYLDEGGDTIGVDGYCNAKQLRLIADWLEQTNNG